MIFLAALSQVCGEATAQELSGFGGKKGAYWVMIDEEHAFGNYSPSIYDDLKVPLFFWCFSLERHIKNKVQRCAIFLLSIGSSEVPFNPQYLEPILAW